MHTPHRWISTLVLPAETWELVDATRYRRVGVCIPDLRYFFLSDEFGQVPSLFALVAWPFNRFSTGRLEHLGTRAQLCKAFIKLTNSNI